MDRAKECEVRVRGAWVRVSLDDALNRLDASRPKRCIQCHGEVRAHAEGRDGMAAHFEHRHRHKGCSFGDCFDGAVRPHPKALA